MIEILDFDTDDEDIGSRPQTVMCKFCGKDGLEWVDDNGRWKLIIAHTGALHICDFKKIARDFDAI